jgi:carbon monoxide dehydrogenase subunit G
MEIKCPIEKVFAYLSDFKTWSKWELAMSEIELTSGEWLAVGAKLRGINQVMNQRIPWTADVTEYKPNEIIVLNVTSKMALIAERFSAEPVEGGTRVNMAYTVELRGMAKLASSMVMGILEKQVNENLACLKGILEG